MEGQFTIERRLVNTLKKFYQRYGWQHSDGTWRMAGKSARAIHTHETRFEDALTALGYSSDMRYRLLNDCRDIAGLELTAELGEVA